MQRKGHLSEKTHVVLVAAVQKPSISELSTVRWLSVEVLSFKVTLPNCDSRSRAQLVGLPNCDTISFFIEGFKSHCDMQMYRIRTSAIDNRLNFGPQLLSMNI